MAPRRARPRRFLLPTVLAAVLAAEITGLVLARTPTVEIVPVGGPAPAANAASSSAEGVFRLGETNAITSGSQLVDRGTSTILHRSRSMALAKAAEPAGTAVAMAGGRTKPEASTGSSRVATSNRASTTADAAPASYRGVNHVWIPSLGINKGVQLFPCSRDRPPDAGVYRWGCAGRNNVYLLSHAWSTFKPLHDAYVQGTLRKGMQVVYADGAGRVHTYAVIWWRVVAPTTAASWAWASLSTPSMTLQTCVGSNSQYRLMVRLVQIR